MRGYSCGNLIGLGRSASSIPHPKDALTKTPHNSSSNGSATSWSTLCKQSPLPRARSSSPRPVAHPRQGHFTEAAGGSWQTIPAQGLSPSCSAPGGPSTALPCSALQVFGINADWGWASQAGRRHHRKGYTLGLKSVPKRNSHKAAPATALLHLLPGTALLVASRRRGRMCPSLCITVTHSKNSLPSLTDWHPCSTARELAQTCFRR